MSEWDAPVGFDYVAQPKEDVLTCNLCGGVDFRAVMERDRYGYAQRTVRCSSCDLVFLSPRMTAKAYAEFYRSGAYRKLVSAYHGRVIDAKTIQAEQAVYAEQLISFLAPWVVMGGTLLDIGGSTGVVARALAGKFKLNATVIDPAPDELKEASDLGGIQGSIETEDLGPWTFDLVTMCQTADHVLDLRCALKKIRGLLRDIGLFFVDIVDYEQKRESKIDHPYNLTRTTMLSYLARTGFVLIDEGRAEDGVHWRFLCTVAP